MKQVSKLCQECICYLNPDNQNCVGKDTTDVKPGKLPCKKYELDPQLISNETIEPDDRPPSLKDKKPSKPKDLVPDAVLVTNKTKADAFKRLVTQRLTKTLDDFRKLGNLNNKANYEWTQEQINAMVSRIRSAADLLEKKFNK